MRALLRNVTFLRLLGGRLLTNAGDSIYYVAALWLVHDLGGSTLLTGLASSLFMIPSLLQFLVGPVVDSLSVRRVLVASQLGQGLLVLVVPLAAFLDALSIWVVVVVIPLASTLNLVTYPAQASALPRIVDEDHLSDANSLFNFAHEGTNMAFNAAGGVLVALVGAVAVYTIDAATFALAIALFAGLTIPPRPDESDQTAEATGTIALGERTRHFLADLREGLSYLRGTAFLPLLVPSVVVSFAMGGLLAVLPAFAELRGSAGLYGVLLSAFAAGAMVGSLVASRLDHVDYGSVLVVGLSLSGLSWAVGALVPSIPIVVVAFATAILFHGVDRVLFDTLVQSVVPEDHIGRVTSATSTVGTTAAPVGSLVGGALASLPAGPVRAALPPWFVDALASAPVTVIGTETLGPVPIFLVVAALYVVAVAYVTTHTGLRGLPGVAELDRRDDRIEEFGG